MKNLTLSLLIICIIDQLIKILVVSNIAFATSLPIIKNFFRITYLQNTGGAWSILSGNIYLFIIITILIVCFIIWMIKKDLKKTNLKMITYGILLGGILGNFIDRIRLGYVIDYFDFNFGSYQFPVFNIADICIVVSCFILILKFSKEGE